MSIQITDITAWHVAGTPVLKNVSLEVSSGEFASILGPSGSGKTTLLRVIAGLHPAASGRVVVSGRDLTHAAAERRRIGFVPQNGVLFPHLSVGANIAYGLRAPEYRGRAARGARTAELLEIVGLPGMERRMPHELSGGQQQRIALARALAPSPDLVLLDEPFNALDASLRERVRDDVAAILRDQHATTILITHDQEEALSLSDTVSVLRDGQILQTGTPATIYSQPVNEWVARFVGDAVLLDAIWSGGRLRTALGDITPAEQPGADDTHARVLLRPEQLELGADADGLPVAVVRRTRFVGHTLIAELRTEASPPLTITARVPASTPVREGDRVGVTVRGTAHTVVGS